MKAKSDAPKVETKEQHYDPIQERAPDRDVTKADQVSEAKVEDDKKLTPRQQIEKEIADHEKWMSDHSDDARGVQERLQEIAVLQNKLAEMDAPKHETRVRQDQTV